MKHIQKYLVVLLVTLISSTTFSSCSGDDDMSGVETCYTCKGSGRINGSICPTCLGSGVLDDDEQGSYDEEEDDDSNKVKKCYYCKGTGKCQSCDGKGFHYNISLDVPCSTCKKTGKCHLCNGLGYTK